MKFTKNIVSFFSIFLLAFFFFISSVSAQENTNSTMPIFVEALIPENQIDKNHTFFDLRVIPGQEQKLQLKIHNDSQKDKEVVISPQVAKTGEGGNIDYSGINAPLDSSLEHSFEDMISEQQVVNIKARDVVIVTFDLNIPSQGFRGIVLGGFYIEEIVKEDKSMETTTNTVQIKNRYAYIIGCKLRTDTEDIKPEFKLRKIELTEWNDFPSINAELANVKPEVVSNYVYEGTIINKKTGKRKVVFPEARFSMAPNSIFMRPQKIVLDHFENGTYIYALKIRDGDRIWNVEKEFQISYSQKKSVKERILREPSFPWLFLWIALVGVILSTLVCILYRRNSDEK
ncbi:DUF916 and DUF3324 domain-containing protein [Listeria booriae]|uniref:DUF916 and DUF3324 domain-containing protein n=1 Tax=Listeria booriae TaxID=1552123 RepID=A0A841Y9N7_9LIST|nr:DUF916 domain-containing protein [Listeria booriae]MBC1373633.1 DUF916 and DUF3324 domain-containing protein [Listeria booriae]